MTKNKEVPKDKVSWKIVVAISSAVIFVIAWGTQVYQADNLRYDNFWDIVGLLGFSLSIYTLDLVSDVKKMTIDDIDNTINFRITMSSIDDFLLKFVKVNELARLPSGDLSDSQIRDLVDLSKECQVLCSLIKIDEFCEFELAKKEVRDITITKFTIAAIHSSLLKVNVILTKYMEQKAVHEIKHSVKGN